MTALLSPCRVPAFVAGVTAIALLLVGCSGGSERALVGAITPLIVNSEVVVGENRFIVGVLDDQGQEVLGADVTFRFFGPDGEPRDPPGEVAAEAVTIEKSYTHVHEDGTVEKHSAGETGVYRASVGFDEVGEWEVEVAAKIGGGTAAPVRATFAVEEEGASVAVGEPAPRSETPTLDDVSDISLIDTSALPVVEMHELTIAEAVTSGRPSVIVFATPAFCVSRICGPTKDVVDQLYEKYKKDANFVHVEPYDLRRARNAEGNYPIRATQEWGLRSEPWVFIVNSEGTVAAKFEAIVTLNELEQALKPLLEGGGGIGY